MATAHPALDGRTLHERVRVAREMVEANLLRLEQTRTRISVTQAQMVSARPKRDLLHESSYARLPARLEAVVHPAAPVGR